MPVSYPIYTIKTITYVLIRQIAYSEPKSEEKPILTNRLIPIAYTRECIFYTGFVSACKIHCKIRVLLELEHFTLYFIL